MSVSKAVHWAGPKTFTAYIATSQHVVVIGQSEVPGPVSRAQQWSPLLRSYLYYTTDEGSSSLPGRPRGLSSSVEGEIERAVEAVTLPGKPHFAYMTDELQLVGEGSIARVLSCCIAEKLLETNPPVMVENCLCEATR